MDPQTVSSTTLSISPLPAAAAASSINSNTESLILTDLLTSGQNYSFAVAVTDSTGQHGPWSDQLMVTYHGMGILFSDFIMRFVNAVPGIVIFITVLHPTSILVVWQVRPVDM